MKGKIIFSITAIITLLFFLTSCSQDNDWGVDEYSTLAKNKMTRGGEGDDYVGPHYVQGEVVLRDEWPPFGDILITVSWPDCYGWNATLSADVHMESVPDSLLILHVAEASFHRNTDIVGKYSIRIDSTKYHNPNVHNYGRYEYNYEFQNVVKPDFNSHQN